ncbi:MAG: thioredoxin family protein [Paracoccaceae bacterium]|nr:thioredoxin family protein [Rhodobacter sp.]
MNRRDFLTATAAVTLAMPLAAQAAARDYAPDLLAAELAAGKTVFLDFRASWCSTCAAQGRVIEALLQENPAYARAISFINVDWDRWGNGDLVKALNIPRRSTLVVLKGKAELGRVVAQTGKAEIKALLDLALAAA